MSLPDPAKIRILGPTAGQMTLQPLMDRLRSMMTDSVGVVRNAEGLVQAVRQSAAIEREATGRSASVASAALAARLIATAAYLRNESRGGHFRDDFPLSDAAQAKRSRITLEQADAFLAVLEGTESRQRMQGRV
ncbi:MAG: hypothetical protein VCC04_14065 [Myxococcota bacterium]